MIIANLLHLSFNMWEEHDSPTNVWRKGRTSLRFNDAVWDEMLGRMSAAGFNMVVLDLGDGVRYQSHPELAVENAWSCRRLRDEVERIRGMGMELIPKLNFSTCHDAWLGPYSRQVSTPDYYRVCEELIAEVIELTGRPRFFHIGMDEETPEFQRNYNYVVVRQHELFWHDMLFFVSQVERHGSRAWIWSDSIWKHRDAFLAHVPRTVVQGNWYYGEAFGPEVVEVQAYDTLEAHGYDQIPTCSNFGNPRNTGLTVEHCRKKIAPERLLGFLQTPWRPTTPEYREKHVQAIEQLSAAVRGG